MDHPEKTPEQIEGVIAPPCPYLAVMPGHWFCRHANCHRHYPGKAPHEIHPGTTCASCELVKRWPSAEMRDVPTAKALEQQARDGTQEPLPKAMEAARKGSCKKCGSRTVETARKRDIKIGRVIP
jgi:hypothetical protein